MIDFRSDNTGRAAPELLDALIEANDGTALGYGADEWTARLWPAISGLLCIAFTAFAAQRFAPGGRWMATAVTLVGGMAYVSEARLNYRNDPKLRDQDPGPFRAVGVPYKAPR